jgi:hypothetical protein
VEDGRKVAQGCTFDTQTVAEDIALILDSYQTERDAHRQLEREARVGRKTIKLALVVGGAFCAWLVGRGHETLMAFFAWFIKSGL